MSEPTLPANPNRTALRISHQEGGGVFVSETVCVSLTDWQPIETAPKDGTPVLVFCPSYDLQIVVARYGNPYWFLAYCGTAAEDADLHETPTHWMPLPPPPPDGIERAKEIRAESKAILDQIDKRHAAFIRK